MTRGRPRKIGAEICACCSNPGWKFQVPSWNSKYRDASRNMYLRFRHNDRTLPKCSKCGMNDCYIDPILRRRERSGHKTSGIAREYNTLKNEITMYEFRKDDEFPLTRYKKTKGLPIIIYNFYGVGEVQIPDFSGICRQCFGQCNRIHDLRCHICDNRKIVWCPNCLRHWEFTLTPITDSNDISRSKILMLISKKLKKNRLKMGQLKWLIDNEMIQGDAKEFIQNLYDNLKENYHDKSAIITYGDNAIKHSDDIRKKYSSIIKCVTYLFDNYGVLEHLEERKRLSRK